MKAGVGIKVAFGILALYMSIPLSILAAQRMAASQAENSHAGQPERAVAALARR